MSLASDTRAAREAVVREHMDSENRHDFHANDRSPLRVAHAQRADRDRRGDDGEPAVRAYREHACDVRRPAQRVGRRSTTPMTA